MSIFYIYIFFFIILFFTLFYFFILYIYVYIYVYIYIYFFFFFFFFFFYLFIFFFKYIYKSLKFVSTSGFLASMPKQGEWGMMFGHWLRHVTPFLLVGPDDVKKVLQI